jgi:DNA-directed RNA polymerase specialized sigma24 family protein
LVQHARAQSGDPAVVVEHREWWERAAAHLTRGQRPVLHAIMAGKTPAQIAQWLGCELTAVYQRLSTLRKVLRAWGTKERK